MYFLYEIHLKNILDYFDKQEYFDQVDVFIPDETKLQMPKNKRINYFTPYLINKNLIFRIRMLEILKKEDMIVKN